MAPRRKPPSRRVAWPEPGAEDGGEFRITPGRAAAIVGLLVAVMGALPAYWTVSDHWMNRNEIEKAIKVEADKADVHADHDAGVQLWNQYGLAANRLEYLDDKQAECDFRRLTAPKLAAPDAAICARYEAKRTAKAAEAADLRAKAMEATKEKRK